MSASTNTAENTPIAKPIPLDKEVADLGALAQQLVDAKAKNERIVQRKGDQEAKVKMDKEEQEKHDEVDRLA